MCSHRLTLTLYYCTLVLNKRSQATNTTFIFYNIHTHYDEVKPEYVEEGMEEVKVKVNASLNAAAAAAGGHASRCHLLCEGGTCYEPRHGGGAI